MKRAQSTWLTSLPCPPFQKYSHPAVQWQTQGFTRAASPLRLTDWAAFFALKTASSLQLELPLTLQTWAPVRLYILDHPATSQANKPLVAVVVLFPGLWNLDTKVCLIWTSGTTEKDYWNCRRPPPSLPELSSQLWIKDSTLAPDSHYRSHHASLLPAEKRWVVFFIYIPVHFRKFKKWTL